MVTSAAALQCGNDGSHGSIAVQVEEIASSVVGSEGGVVVGGEIDTDAI